MVKVGDEIEVKVLRVDAADRKLGLSRKRLHEPDVIEEETEEAAAEKGKARELRGGTGSSSAPLFSIPDILSGVKNVGKRGIQIYRFKGLGEMDAKELFETTMNPARRKLLRVELTDAIEAEKMFTELMGEEVEPRRRFIEDNALNVRNLDV